MPASNLNAAFQFSRQFGVPLDKDLVFASSSARTAYPTDPSTSGIAYVGMIVADTETNKAYVLNSSRSWIEIGQSAINDTFTTGILVKTGNNSFSSRSLTGGSNIILSNSDGVSDNPNISLSSSLTGLTSVTISGSLSLNGNNITADLEAVKDTNTANFNNTIGYMTSVGTNGGPSYYGTYDQAGNAKEYVTTSVTTDLVVLRGGNFNTYVTVASGTSDQLYKGNNDGSSAPNVARPGVGFRLASRYNVNKKYSLVFTANNSTIGTSGSVAHGFQINDPIIFTNVDGSSSLPSGLSTSIYYIKTTGISNFTISSVTGGSPVTPTSIGSNITSCSIYTNYGSFVDITGINVGDTSMNLLGAVSYDYRMGKYEITNDDYVEFLNAVGRDDEQTVSGSNYGLYNGLMETEAPNNAIAVSSAYPVYVYNCLQSKNKKPVNFVSWRSAARYANWLHNGKPAAQTYRYVGFSNINGVTSAVCSVHGFVTGDEIMFDVAPGSAFSSGITAGTKFKVGTVLGSNGFIVKTTNDQDVNFSGTGGYFYVRKYFDKSSAINIGAYDLTGVETTAPVKVNTARYWIPDTHEWYKAAYYDPNKGGAGVPGYWSYPTRSDTLPTPVTADSDGNGSYGTQIPGHTHSSYDITDFAGRVGSFFIDGSGTSSIVNTTNNTIGINVTGIPLSNVVDVTASATEVNYLDLSTGAGTAEASKALVLNSNKSITGITNISSTTGNINYISGVTGVFGASNNTDNASTLVVGTTNVSLSGHKHYYDSVNQRFDDIPGFCSGVADCLDTSLSASTGIVFNYSSNAVNVSLSGQALALHNLSTNGIIVRSGIGVVASRTITSGVNINITNGDGLAGNPTIALSSSVSGLTDLTVDQIKIDGSTISTTGNDDSITLAPHGSGDVNVNADTLRVGDSGAAATITTNGAGNLVLNTNAGSNSSSITIANAANGDITLSANGTGEVNINRVDIDGGTIDNTVIGSGTAASGNFTVVTVDNTKIDNDKIYLSNIARIDLNSTETAINNPEGNVNFRVAGSGSSATNLLFVDATNNRVGIGTNSPSSLFSVSGAVNFNSTITAPNIGTSASSNSLVTLDGGLLKTRSVDSRVWGSPSNLVDGDGSGSAGGIPFWSDSNSLTQNNTSLFWDSGNNRLGIGINSPLYSLDVRGNSYISGNLIVGNNLTISGTTVVANVDTMTVKDPIINLGLTQGNTIADTDYDRGLALSLSSTRTAFMGWDTSESEFVMLSSGVPGTASGTYTTGTYGAFRAGTINSIGSFNGRVLNVTGTLNTALGVNNGQINLNGSNGNFISWNTDGQGVPTTSVRSSGTKLVFYPDLSSGSNTDTAIGTSDAGQTLWHSIKASSAGGNSASFKWYVGSSEKANLDNNGNFATSGTITSNGAGGFTGNGSSITGVNAYGLNVYSNSLTDTVTSLVMVTGTGTGNLRPFIDSGLKFNANTNTLILENISGTLSTVFNSTTYNNVFTATSISGLAAFGTSNESYLLNFIIDGGTP